VFAVDPETPEHIGLVTIVAMRLTISSVVLATMLVATAAIAQTHQQGITGPELPATGSQQWRWCAGSSWQQVWPRLDTFPNNSRRSVVLRSRIRVGSPDAWR